MRRPGLSPAPRQDATAAYARSTGEFRLSPELPDAWREIAWARDLVQEVESSPPWGGDSWLRQPPRAAPHWTGDGPFTDNQTPGTVARVSNKNGSERGSSTAYQAGTATWDPIYSLRPC
ncbi:hypothetical protein ACFWWC_01975 [Streptomyces sp. NPDC058642]|uniref:hypothetical protein n=1 Tax=Streptomyces sp. NPDC058642 TaxID=3346572 RepID=UPI003666CB7A